MLNTKRHKPRLGQRFLEYRKLLWEALAKAQEERMFAGMKKKKGMTRDSFVCLALGQCLAVAGVN